MNYLNNKRVPARVLAAVAILAVSLLLLGTLGSYLVWRTSSAYDRLAERDFAVLNLLRSISRESSANRRVANSILELPDGQARNQLVERYNAGVEVNNVNFDRLRTLVEDKELLSEVELMGAHRSTYIAYFRPALLSDIDRLNSVVKPTRPEMDRLYDEYWVQQDKVANLLEQIVEINSRQVTKEWRFLFVFFVAVALWPLLLGGGVFVYMFVSTLLIFWRNRT